MQENSEILTKSLLEREILPDILKWVQHKEAIVLLGSRQVGKSSLLYLLIQQLANIKNVSPDDIFYFDLEILKEFELLNSGIEALIDYIQEQSPKKTKKYLFIDEIQYLDDPSRLLKLLVDHHSENIKVFVTGSSALMMKKKFRDSLIGRKITFEIFSLNFREYLLFKKETQLQLLLVKNNHLKFKESLSSISHHQLLKAYFDYITYGGYPAIVLLKENDKKKKYLDDIYSSYIRKDINALFSLENITGFNKLLKWLALNIGNLINIQEVSKEIGLTRQTIEKYFSILEGTYICRFIQPYFTNKQKEIIKMNKVYFYDTGLRNRIINDFRNLQDRIDKGALIENAVFKNLLRHIENKENIKFWRMKYGVEVDFILDEEQLTPIEVKSMETDSIPSGIASFHKRYGTLPCLILNLSQFKKQGSAQFVPFYLV